MSPQRNRCQMGSHQRTERAGNEVFSSSEFLLLPAEAWLQCQPKNIPFCLSHSGWDFLSLRRMGAQSEVLGFACTWEFTEQLWSQALLILRLQVTRTCVPTGGPLSPGRTTLTPTLLIACLPSQLVLLSPRSLLCSPPPVVTGAAPAV